jgi:hypothetical protein
MTREKSFFGRMKKNVFKFDKSFLNPIKDMYKNIILLGPMAVGKTTTAKYLSTITGIDFIEIDEIRNKFFNKIDYNHSEAMREFEKDGFVGLTRYWKPYELHTILRSLEEYEYKIFDFAQDFLCLKVKILPK